MVPEIEREEVGRRLRLLPPSSRLDFLEFLAHNLTIAVREAFANELSAEQQRKAVYWLNEAQHNLVQLIHGVRTAKEPWEDDQVTWWLNHWMTFQHAGGHVLRAIDYTFFEMGLKAADQEMPDRQDDR